MQSARYARTKQTTLKGVRLPACCTALFLDKIQLSTRGALRWCVTVEMKLEREIVLRLSRYNTPIQP